jgi:long-chain acyl-CoA synthetase
VDVKRCFSCVDHSKVVIGGDNAYRGEAVKVFAVLKEEHRRRVSKAGFLTLCQGRLMPYRMPRLVGSRDEFPLRAAGKMLRPLLRGGVA